MSSSDGAGGLSITPRRSDERGHADHGWLKTFHTFNFAMYFDPRFESFEPLRVINEDRVLPNEGFGRHSHREFNIWSYVVKGQLEHKDSMGNIEYIKRGEVQMTWGGTGISHSEYNRHPSEEVHFLQIWAKPSVPGLKPTYFTSKFSDESKRDTLVPIVVPVNQSLLNKDADKQGLLPDGEAIPIHSGLAMFASILSPGSTVTHTFGTKTGAQEGAKRNVYVHLISNAYRAPGAPVTPDSNAARIKLDGRVELREGDGAFVRGGSVGHGEGLKIESVGEKDAEFLVFDLDP